jgi:hypothetical protein
MPQIPVIGYALQVSTNSLQQPCAPPAAFRAGIAIQLQPGGPFQPQPIKEPDEFMAVVALIQTQGRLMFDPVATTLEKIEP